MVSFHQYTFSLYRWKKQRKSFIQRLRLGIVRFDLKKDFVKKNGKDFLAKKLMLKTVCVYEDMNNNKYAKMQTKENGIN